MRSTERAAEVGDVTLSWDAAMRKSCGDKVTASKSLDGCSEETLNFDVQVEEPTLEKAGQLCAYGGFADTADAGDEYTHDSTLGERFVLPGACDRNRFVPATGHSTTPANARRIGFGLRLIWLPRYAPPSACRSIVDI